VFRLDGGDRIATIRLHHGSRVPLIPQNVFKQPFVCTRRNPIKRSIGAPAVLCDVIIVVTEFMVSVIPKGAPAVLCDVIIVVTEFMASVIPKGAPSVLCDVISVVTEFMVSVIPKGAPSVLCDVISVVTEPMVSVSTFSIVWRHQCCHRVYG
jgi:hypothetical protein